MVQFYKRGLLGSLVAYEQREDYPTVRQGMSRERTTRQPGRVRAERGLPGGPAGYEQREDYQAAWQGMSRERTTRRPGRV